MSLPLSISLAYMCICNIIIGQPLDRPIDSAIAAISLNRQQ